MEFTIRLQKEHAKLRQKYYRELVIFLAIFLLGMLTLLVLETFSFTHIFGDKLNIVWAFLLYALFNLAALLYFPWRAKRLQKQLILVLFNSLKAEGILLIPNIQGGQDFNYVPLLRGSGFKGMQKPEALSRYEYGGRLVHVLHFKAGDDPFVIIHIPKLECPYYLQINNGHYPPVYSFRGDEVVPVSFVSRNNLVYYATKGPSEVKVFIRRPMERKFYEFITIRPGTYQYIKTYNDEFLRVQNYTINNLLCLTSKYSDSYLKTLKDELKYLQSLMYIMLEKGR